MDSPHALGRYLAASPIIDWDHPAVREKALTLSGGQRDEVEVARRCFLFVRDDISHSGDLKLDPVTLKASDVLEHRTGFCYAKSHLLAALLRANGIPTGLCYQRLTRDNGRVFIHGLNAVHLKGYGWYRADARGNSNGTHADFTPPREALPYAVKQGWEADLPEVWAEPLPVVVEALTAHRHYHEVLNDLPDVELVRGD